MENGAFALLLFKYYGKRSIFTPKSKCSIFHNIFKYIYTQSILESSTLPLSHLQRVCTDLTFSSEHIYNTGIQGDNLLQDQFQTQILNQNLY